MTTKELEKTVKKLSKEVSSMRSFIVESVLSFDDEGEYKKTFVNAIAKAAKQKASFKFQGRGSLLKQIASL